MDPRIQGAFPGDRKQVASRLMLAKLANKDGSKINLCPYGCEDQQLDENGYCRHLVGFTNDKKTYEPMVRSKGRRLVRVPRPEPILTGKDADGENEYEEAPPEPLPCQKGDKFEQITTSWRVYRDVDAQKETSAPDKVVKKPS